MNNTNHNNESTLDNNTSIILVLTHNTRYPGPAGGGGISSGAGMRSTHANKINTNECTCNNNLKNECLNNKK